jgi:hypothetical protein
MAHNSLLTQLRQRRQEPPALQHSSRAARAAADAVGTLGRLTAQQMWHMIVHPSLSPSHKTRTDRILQTLTVVVQASRV